MRHVLRPLAFTLVLVLLAPPAFAQAPKGGAKTPATGGAKGPGVPADKAPAAPGGITATQTDSKSVTIDFKASKDPVSEYRVYVSMSGGAPRLVRAVIRQVTPILLELAEIAQSLGVPVASLAGRVLGFSVEAVNPKGLVSPKASAALTVTGAGTTPDDTASTPGGTGSTSSSTPAGTKDAAASDKAWAAQTSRSEVTLAWNAPKGATGQRLVFEFNGRQIPLGSFAPNVGRAVFTLARLAQLVEQRVDALRGAPLIFRIESMIGARVAGVLAFNRVVPVSPEKGLASKQAPADVKASQTGPSEITLTWQPNPDATAYAIGRAVGNEGFRMLCALCSTENARYVDTEATPGVKHVYTVQAVTVDGMGARATSNPLPEEAPKGAAQR